MDLNFPIEKISGVGPETQRKLKKIGVKTALDLLFYFPYRYEDFSNLINIADVKINEVCTIKGEVIEIESERTWRRKMAVTSAIIQDKTGAIKATWFNQPYLSKVIKKGDEIFLSGKVSFDSKGNVYLSNPVYEKGFDSIHTGRLVPIYPETEGLSSRWIRRLLKFLLDQTKNNLPETLPAKIIQENGLMPIEKALWQIHFPDSQELIKKAKERFSFEEIFFIELLVLRERFKLNKEKAGAIPMNVGVIKRFTDSLNFKLTDSQKKSAWYILKDMERQRPMNRLLEGDVGSGKTVVAVIAALNAIKAGCQVAFMAPTEILSKQHFSGVSRLLENFNLNLGFLTGKQDQFKSRKLKNDTVEISRKKLLEKTLKGEINILIGTHALIQDKVKFDNLGLVVVDEQHRFGVAQRAKLCKTSKGKEKPIIPHLLSMTATPIPRTLALTLYGDLDISIIDELPKGRKKIITKIVKPENREKTYEFIRGEVKNGRQIFVICPRIDIATPNEKNFVRTEMKAVKEEYEKLSKKIFPELKVGMLHGKIAVKEKERIMLNFKNKKIDILVSTSVVEVGIDIPNATVMMIEGADRFGLAQLHQFRGRVGRGEHQSYCFLFSDSSSEKTLQRLKALSECENGFDLAEKDLEIRGPGDLVGTRQWGIPDLMMDALKNIALVEKTRETAKALLIENPSLNNYPELKLKLENFSQKLHLE